jgi:Flp pilus assembly protein TadB
MRFFLPLPRRSRHPFVRALSLLVGVALVGVLLVFGLLVVSVMLVGGALLLGLRHWQKRRVPTGPTAARPANVLEGEFVVIQQGRPVAH